jgi:hypothetical protein
MAQQFRNHVDVCVSGWLLVDTSDTRKRVWAQGVSRCHCVQVGGIVYYNGGMWKIVGFYDPSVKSKIAKAPGKWLPLPLEQVLSKLILDGSLKMLLTQDICITVSIVNINTMATPRHACTLKLHLTQLIVQPDQESLGSVCFRLLQIVSVVLLVHSISKSARIQGFGPRLHKYDNTTSGL